MEQGIPLMVLTDLKQALASLIPISNPKISQSQFTNTQGSVTQRHVASLSDEKQIKTFDRSLSAE